jgi:glycosidase
MFNQPFERKQQITWSRLRPRIEDEFNDQISTHPNEWMRFLTRLEDNFSSLFSLYSSLYASQYDFFYHLESLLSTITRMWFERPEDLKALDLIREMDPLWFQSNNTLGGVCYVDLFAGNFTGIREQIPYYKELGLTYLHLMPLYKTLEGENDGGYAISSYREVDSRLGSMEELIALATELRENGISLVLDFVFNHTSDEHDWALKAISGDIDYQEYYRMYPDRLMPDAYEQNLREIFPDEHPGAFTYREELGKWVWTTFHSYQWDLNYANPVVFNRMIGEMLFLANAGVEVMRLDAVAFVWKQMGTSCENLPEAHTLIKAFNVVKRIAAPSLVFKSEAIVHPDEVLKYIAPDECEISYNPLVMALLWESLATRKTQLLRLALSERYEINERCSWVNYVRSHDDIGWTFSDEDASRLEINGFDHRKFLNDFYTGIFSGSFARGLPFQSNPKTNDMRISGTTASLAGLEKALEEEKSIEVDMAVRRILLIYGVVMALDGIPLIYLGDEVGILNDYSYRKDSVKFADSRWVHRSERDIVQVEKRKRKGTIENQIYLGIKKAINIRKTNDVLSNGDLEVMDLGNEHVLGFVRYNSTKRVIVLANFSESEQLISEQIFRIYGASEYLYNLATGIRHQLADITLAPYEIKLLEIL